MSNVGNTNTIGLPPEMLTRRAALASLEEAFALGAKDVYVGAGQDEPQYLASLEASIRACFCEPFEVTAEVMPPGFPFANVGSNLMGWCIAHNPEGYWLVYQPAERRFLCFWGVSQSRLGAHGVYGSPLYCWSA